MKTRQEAKRKTILSSSSKPERVSDSCVNVPGKRETKIKTPKVKGRRSDQWNQTPGRDDHVLFSQHFDSQAVVGWDCNSPDHVRGIRKFSGADGSDVTDLIKLIADKEDEVVQKRNTPPLLGMWRDTQDPKLLDNHLLPNRIRGKRRHRKKSGKESTVAQDLYDKLTLALDKCTDVNKATDERYADGEMYMSDTCEQSDTAMLNNSDDLFTTMQHIPSTDAKDIHAKDSIDNADNISPTYHAEVGRVKDLQDRCRTPVRASPRLEDKRRAEQNTNVCTASKGVNIGSTAGTSSVDDDWSDDELFDEDSFIIKATQMPPEAGMLASPVFSVKRKSASNDQPQSKFSRTTFQIGDSNNNKSSKVVCDSNKQFTHIQHKLAPKAAVTPITDACNGIQTRSGSLIASNCTSSLNAAGTGNGNVLGKGATLSNSKAVVKQSSGQSLAASFYSSKRTTGPTGVTSKVINNLNKVCPISAYQHNPTKYNSCTSSSTSGAGNRFTTPNVQNSNLRVSSNSLCNNNRSSAFKKHNSFSGSDPTSQVLHSPRRRSISGDGQIMPNIPGTCTSTSTTQPVCASTRTAGQNPSCFGNQVRQPTNTVRQPTNTVVNKMYKPPITQTVTSSRQPKQYTLSTKPPVYSSRTSTGVNVKSCVTSSCAISNASASKQCIDVKPGTISATSRSTANSLASGNSTNSVINKILTPLKESDFDTSLSDDLLCELAEPDELLDSQVFNLNPQLDDKTSKIKNKPVSSITSTISKITEAVNVVSISSRARNCSSAASNMAAVTTTKPNCVPNLPISSVKQTGQARQFQFKASQKLSCNDGANREVDKTCSGLQATTTNTTEIVTKVTNQKTSKGALEQCSEDLFSSDEDDILLTDDDGLTEPQILAMLEQAELFATQQSKAVKNDSTSRNNVPQPRNHGIVSSQEHITTNSKDPGQHHNGVSGSQEQRTNISCSQGQSDNQELPNSQGPSCSQGISSSQTKYSPEEIERKKQQALARRKHKSVQQSSTTNMKK